MRRLVIDFSFRKPDGSKGRYRHDAEVQTLAAARDEDRRRLASLATTGSPFEVLGKAREEVAPAAPRELTFAEVADMYLAEYAPSRLKPSTHEVYANVIEARLKPRLGKLPLGAIDAKVVRELDTEQVRAKVGLYSRRQTLIVLRSIVVRFALEAGLRDRAPNLPPLPKIGATIPFVMSVPEFNAVLSEGCIYPEHRLAFLLGGHAGLRRGEIRALRCRDVDLANNRLVVRTAIWGKIEGPPKSGHEREVPLTPTLRDALVQARVDKRAGDERAALSAKGKPWAQSSLRAAFMRALKRAKLPKWRLHDLRHFFVTALLVAHIPAHVVRELAGHADLATTQRYAHATAGDRGVAIVTLGEVCERQKQKKDEAA